ncbi:hypothetical protein ACIQPR_48625 [Streptomyces sp. NPDC091280]|uniref:hypothetical protein n=1 Tax=Streptomyces sp. NPDC091280 TaxID=3365984 RepID=UPI0037F3EAC2
MKTEYNGRAITIRKPVMKYGPCTFTIGDSDELPVYPGMVDKPSEPAAVLAWIQQQIDRYDAEAVEPLMAVWWYRPGTVEECPSTKGTVRGTHIKPVDGPCTEMWCVREAKIEAQRAARRTGITASTLSAKLTRSGYTRADLNWDNSTRSEGFDASDEQRRRRVRISWRGTDYTIEGLQGELPAIGAFLIKAGHPVRIASGGGNSVWVYPRGTTEPTEGHPFPAEDNETPEPSGGQE